MSYVSNKIGSLSTQSTFTAKVIQDSSKRYANTSGADVVFTVGYEYTGVSIYKGSSRPPKLRILSIFKPVLSKTGQVNSNNDTYVAFSVYDYSLGRFRGPACRRSTVGSAIGYNDFYVTTIDKFGKNYGNLFTGQGSSTSTFTAPSVSYAATLQVQLKSGVNVTISSGHYTGCYTLAGPNNTTLDFNGFFSLSGLSGTYCFYTIADNGSPKEFRNTPDSIKYTANTYPYLLPKTNKYVSEWRCSPICNLDDVGYSPLVRPNIVGPIKYVLPANPDPASGFNNGTTETRDIWVTADWSDYLSFFSGPIYADQSGSGVQGEYGYAAAGYYGPTSDNYYAYWDGTGNWGGLISYGGGGGADYQKFQFLGPFFDPMSACDEMGERIEYFEGYVDVNQSATPNIGQTVFSDATGTSTVAWAAPGMWFKVFDGGFTPLNYTVTLDPGMVIDNNMGCR